MLTTRLTHTSNALLVLYEKVDITWAGTRQKGGEREGIGERRMPGNLLKASTFNFELSFFSSLFLSLRFAYFWLEIVIASV